MHQVSAAYNPHFRSRVDYAMGNLLFLAMSGILWVRGFDLVWSALNFIALDRYRNTPHTGCIYQPGVLSYETHYT